jgi:hypothetical protein
MRSISVRWAAPFVIAGVVTAAVYLFSHPVSADASSPASRSNAGSMVMQFAGRGFLEDHPPGDVDGTRFEGRFVVLGLTGRNGPVFGQDVSLFDEQCVKQFGRGPQCAHLVAVRSGFILEGFDTGGGGLIGHTVGRTSTQTRLRIFYDAHPDGTRNFEERASFLKGELVGTYQAEEYFQIDSRAGVFDTRVNYTLLKSKQFTHMGRSVDLAALAPRMTELAHGHNPEPDPTPEAIPHQEPYFDNRGPGEFTQRFPVGGPVLATK